MRVDWRVVDTLALVYCGHRHSLIYSTATRTIQLGSNARWIGPSLHASLPPSHKPGRAREHRSRSGCSVGEVIVSLRVALRVVVRFGDICSQRNYLHSQCR